MGTRFDSLDGFIQTHVRQLLASSGLPDGPDALEALAGAWLEKKAAFEAAVAGSGMEEVDFLAKDDERGALLMTYSGSLLNLGPLVGGGRRCEYASIGLRPDLPQFAVEESSRLDADVEADAVASFAKGPVRRTSPLLKIALFKKRLTPQIEEAKLAEVTQAVGQEFAELNKTVVR